MVSIAPTRCGRGVLAVVSNVSVLCDCTVHGKESSIMTVSVDQIFLTGSDTPATFPLGDDTHYG